MGTQADRLQQLRVRLPRRRGGALWIKPLVIVLIVFGALYWFGVWPFSSSAEGTKPESEGVAPTPAPVVVPREAPPTSIGEKPPASEPARQKPPPTAAEVKSASDRAQEEIAVAKNGDADALRRAVGKWVLDERIPQPTRDDLLKQARDLSKRVVFSASPMQHTTTVVVQPNDTLSDICGRLRSSQKIAIMPAFIEMVNDVKSTRLRQKMPLKIPTEPLSILVDKGEYRLYLLLGGVYLKDYPVGIGKDQRTPEGRFTIHSKTKNPQWTDPETGRVYAFGEPGHVIGSRWMAFASEGARTGFGIHGTVDPASVGRSESAGCVRMLKADVEELFDLVPQGAEVNVRP